MKKKILFPILLILILSSCKKNEEPTAPSKPEDDFSDRLSYAEMDKEKLWGYNDFIRFGNYYNLKFFYDKIDEIYQAFDKSNKSLTKTTITNASTGVSKYYYVIEKVDYESYSLTEYEAISVIKTYSYDHPRYFWISDDILTNENDVALTCDSNYYLYAQRKMANDNIDKYINNLRKLLPLDISQKDLITTIHNYILDNGAYGIPTLEFDAHNIIGITNYNLGVCESYAKTFQYLLNIFGVDAVFACGTVLTSQDTLESHAWTLVNYNNDWYLVDPTWDDPDNIRTNFLKTKDNTSIYHPDQNTDMIYAEYFNYILPELK